MEKWYVVKTLGKDFKNNIVKVEEFEDEHKASQFMLDKIKTLTSGYKNISDYVKDINENGNPDDKAYWDYSHFHDENSEVAYDIRIVHVIK